jgi:hypothetical protein
MDGAVGRTGLAALVVLGGLVLAGPSQATHVAPAAASPCHTRDLVITKAGQEGAAGNRYLDIEVKNVSADRCRLTGFPTFTWQRHRHDIGWPSVHEVGQTASPVVIRPDHAAYTTLHWVDPGPVPPARCRVKRATAVHMTLPSRPHVHRIAIRARVCTTKEYRPAAFPLRSTIALS